MREIHFPLTGGFFEISLSHQPASDVVVSVIFSDPSLAFSFGGISSLTFTSRNWNAVQIVNLVAQEDTDTADNDYNDHARRNKRSGWLCRIRQ